MLVEDWLRGCVHHDGRHGEVTLPCDDVLNIADYIERTRNKIEVVRCRDCKWWDKDDNYSYGYCMAMKHGYISANWEIGIYRKYKGDFYCADGERGEADDDS